jgi:hypothetical protein
MSQTIKLRQNGPYLRSNREIGLAEGVIARQKQRAQMAAVSSISFANERKVDQTEHNHLPRRYKGKPTYFSEIFEGRARRSTLSRQFQPRSAAETYAMFGIAFIIKIGHISRPKPEPKPEPGPNPNPKPEHPKPIPSV